MNKIQLARAVNKDATSTLLAGVSIAAGCLGVILVLAGWATALIAALACYGTLMVCVGAENR